MIITGKMLSFGTSGTGNGGDLTTVKTDGTTITGDGNTMPLALGPGIIDGVGGYAMAYCSGNGAGHDSYGETICGSSLRPTSYAISGYQGHSYVVDTSRPRYLPGVWRLCCEAITTTASIGLYQRIA
ncbi:hypothetical protein G3601_001859 [Salmonella enterica]|uniref:Uncharacterized protein n=2 Tax=Salmonella enterica TaxID=28901 RepID=A0A603X6I3_SALER|nr:hypothetical protein [Salmonella enterica]ECB7403097.1 hypothetical protein [Salmonella enterica subsp. enterica serovar Java]EDQ0179023.1 hypothetical protein [Salmonella enterica subsp. enterica serovar 4,[5],12:b:-]EDS7006228.1 hypothetical protein [Salmonella enterica subsp. diarizonae]EDU1742811.1 hypothetical protein [Salmonella enterica subsp. enterica serovar Cerro]EDV9615594.1 hypothetical protein [Salmonella enterica subsp. enterica serovar Paratyphi B]EEE5610726.1 hypothetical p